MRFSIIMPCYNLGSIVARAIESVLNQTYNDFELIIVDDGSTDDTLVKINSYARNESRIKVFSKPNGGVSSARNFGMARAAGEYILFLDADDFVQPSLLSDALLKFEATGADIFSFGYVKVDEQSGRVLKRYSSMRYDGRVFSGEHFQKMFFSRTIPQHICSMIIKKSVIAGNNIAFDESTKYAEDQEFQLKCNLKCKHIYYDSTQYFHYVQRYGSAVNQKVIREDFDVYIRMKRVLTEQLIACYNNYLCYVFIANILEIRRWGSNRDTVKKLLEMDYVIRSYNVDFTKHGLLTALFIVPYRLFYKRYIMHKYKISRS